MSDQELRELERRWKSTGSTDDEAAFLLERVRTGELWPERLELASYMAHAAAVVALGNRAPKVPANEGEWLDSLYARWGQEAFIRAILAAVAYLDHDRHENPLLVEAVSLAEQWISGVSKAVPTLAMPTQRNSPPKAKKITALYIHQALVRPSDWEPGPLVGSPFASPSRGSGGAAARGGRLVAGVSRSSCGSDQRKTNSSPGDGRACWHRTARITSGLRRASRVEENPARLRVARRSPVCPVIRVSFDGATPGRVWAGPRSPGTVVTG